MLPAVMYCSNLYFPVVIIVFVVERKRKLEKIVCSIKRESVIYKNVSEAITSTICELSQLVKKNVIQEAVKKNA